MLRFPLTHVYGSANSDICTITLVHPVVGDRNALSVCLQLNSIDAAVTISQVVNLKMMPDREKMNRFCSIIVEVALHILLSSK